MALSKTQRKTGGGKLHRTETVTIRLDPRTRYLTELAARRQRRTVSSFIEWAIGEALQSVSLKDETDTGPDFVFTDAAGNTYIGEVKLADVAERLWDPFEADRIVKLGLHFPELQNYREQVLWKLIRECGVLWRGEYGDQGHWKWQITLESIDFQKLQEHWDTLQKIASGEANYSELPQVGDRKPVKARRR